MASVWKFGDVEIKDVGGHGQLFGRKDMEAALKAGADPELVKKQIEQSDKLRAQLLIDDPAQLPATATADAGGIGSKLGAAISSAKEGKIGTGLGASGDYVGGLDLGVYETIQAGQGADITSGSFSQNVRDQLEGRINPNLSGAPKLAGDIRGYKTAATAQDTADDTLLTNQKLIEKADDYYQNQLKIERQGFADQLDLMRQQEKASVQRQQEQIRRQATEALKVNYQGSSPVGQRLAKSRFKRSAAFGSGAASRGTGQFARSGKGSQIRGLNVG